MVRTWGLRLLLLLGSVLGVFLVLALTLQVPGVARGLGAPDQCVTCHNMGAAYTSHAASAHRDQTCGECHVPAGLVARPLEEIRASIVHVTTFLTGPPDVIHASSSSQAIVQSNCKSCHAATLRNVSMGDRNCSECHRLTPHGERARVN